MWPDQVSNQGPLTYESGALPTALCGPASHIRTMRERALLKAACIRTLVSVGKNYTLCQIQMQDPLKAKGTNQGH